ncbi:MAG: hypothetical protein ABL898_17250 [Hyphomicrobiaceae bacterium]|nr:hypothetical protein [Hyphomicrobiaceae bacterium]
MDKHEIAERVLSELDEAGEENAASLANTSLDQTGLADERAIYELAINDLLSAAFIDLATKSKQQNHWTIIPPVKTLPPSLSLTSLLTYDPRRQCWTWATETKILLVLTDTGRRKSEQLLTERGHRWWRKAM